VPTPAERQALFFLAAVAALGVGVRACRVVQEPAVAADSRAALADQIARVDSAVASGGARRRGVRAAQPRVTDAPRKRDAPRAPVVVSPVDVDVADIAALDKLPGIGPALAARIVEDRTQHGPFGSFEALEGVRGIGPALIERLRPHVTFSAPPRPSDAEGPGPKRRRHP